MHAALVAVALCSDADNVMSEFQKVITSWRYLISKL